MNEVCSDTLVAVPWPHLARQRPQMQLPRSGCGFFSASPSANVSACFARQLNPQLTAPVWVILKGSGWNRSPAGSLELSISAVFRDNNTHALRPPAPVRGCTSAVAAIEIQLVLNLPITVFKISKNECSTFPTVLREWMFPVLAEVNSMFWHLELKSVSNQFYKPSPF